MVGPTVAANPGRGAIVAAIGRSETEPNRAVGTVRAVVVTAMTSAAFAEMFMLVVLVDLGALVFLFSSGFGIDRSESKERQARDCGGENIFHV